MDEPAEGVRPRRLFSLARSGPERPHLLGRHPDGEYPFLSMDHQTARVDKAFCTSGGRGHVTHWVAEIPTEEVLADSGVDLAASPSGGRPWSGIRRHEIRVCQPPI